MKDSPAVQGDNVLTIGLLHKIHPHIQLLAEEEAGASISTGSTATDRAITVSDGAGPLNQDA